MTEVQKKFVQMDKKKQEVKDFLKEYSEVSSQLFQELGENGHFQDEEGTVYQATVPTGTFVEFQKCKIIRTRRPGEKRGDLSLTAAKDLGYKIN